MWAFNGSRLSMLDTIARTKVPARRICGVVGFCLEAGLLHCCEQHQSELGLFYVREYLEDPEARVSGIAAGVSIFLYHYNIGSHVLSALLYKYITYLLTTLIHTPMKVLLVL